MVPPITGSIVSMPKDDELDPAASTQMFQAFVDRREPEASGPSRTPVLVAAALVGLVVLLALAWLLLGR